MQAFAHNVNLKSYQFSADEISLLGKSLIKEIGCAVESSIRLLPKLEEDVTHYFKINKIFRIAEPSANISKHEKMPFKILKSNLEIVILFAGKRTATVILDSSQYSSKINIFLQDGPYTPSLVT